MEQQSLRRQLNATEAQLEAFIQRLDRFLNENIKKILRGLEKGSISAQRAAQALGSLQSELLNAGLAKELQRIEKIYGTQLEHINSYYAKLEGKEAVLNDADFTVAETLIKFDISAIANKVYALTDDLASTIMRQVVTGEQPNVSAIVDDYSGATVGQVKTELNTATIAFSRAITQKKAADLGYKYFLYIGADDKLTRPFCKARLNKVFTWEEIQKWDNGQGLPASIYLGGYNCRHDLRPISEEQAKRLGYAD